MGGARLAPVGKSRWGPAGHLLSAARAAFGKGAAPVHSQLTLIAVLWQAAVRWGAALPTAGGFHGRDRGKKEAAGGAYRAARAGGGRGLLGTVRGCGSELRGPRCRMLCGIGGGDHAAGGGRNAVMAAPLEKFRCGPFRGRSGPKIMAAPLSNTAAMELRGSGGRRLYRMLSAMGPWGVGRRTECSFKLVNFFVFDC